MYTDSSLLCRTSAYLGGANLLSDKSLLTTAASIATVEGRHSGLLNLFSGATGVPQYGSYIIERTCLTMLMWTVCYRSQDIPLAPEQVLAIAGSFLYVPQSTPTGKSTRTMQCD